MGTPDFAVATLNALVEAKHNIVGVITSPDKPAGRGYKLQQSAVKKYAVEKELNILQPTNLKNEEFVADLKSLNADLFVVVAFRMLPEVVWGMPEKGTVNLHGSLLPQYRGAAPINWAVMNGEEKTGVTTFFIQQQIDTGNIIDNAAVEIGENETAGELHDKLMMVGADLMVKTVAKIEDGNFFTKQQDHLNEDELKKAYKIFKDVCKIDWNKDLDQIHNHVRGLSPYPAAWTNLYYSDKKKKLKVFITRKEEKQHTKEVGSIDTDNKTYLSVYIKGGLIQIKELQLEGKKRMKVEDFLRGIDLSNNDKVE